MNVTTESGLGGTIVLPDGTKKNICNIIYSLTVDETLLLYLGDHHKKQIIFAIEMLASVVALKLWSPRLDCLTCLFFVDHEGSKFSFLKGCSDITSWSMRLQNIL